jgi:DNA-binding NtrC family response regulator
MTKAILVVEDDADIGAFLVELLKLEEPFQALLTTNGSQALEIKRSSSSWCCESSCCTHLACEVQWNENAR